ncbi:hypothetical protein GCM10027589_16620 [Actinocorallia lasiicapitis]
MSSYEYYEFVAVDQPLDARQRSELRALSTRARITSTSFVNEYHWGSFRGDPHTMMERYFDAHLYLANWGTRILILRLPRAALGLTIAQRYCGGHNVATWASGDHVFLYLSSEEEEEYWEEDGEHRLGGIVGLRTEIASGDLRPLYLAWLLAVQSGEIDDDETEPPVPANLATLSAAQRSMSDFLRLDDDLLTVAAEASPHLVSDEPTDAEYTAWIELLPAEDKDTLLLKTLRNPTAARAALQRRFHSDRRPQPTPDPSNRTASQLLSAAENRDAERRKAEQEREAREQERRERKAAKAREQRLQDLRREGDLAWQRVETHIATKKPTEYDAAITLLRDLRELAEQDRTIQAFHQRIDELRTAHQRKPSLMERLTKANL